MHRNFYWLSFLAIVLIYAAGYTVYTFYKVYKYDRLTHQVPVELIRWSVVTISDEEFRPQADYQFHFHNRSYQGQTVWNESYLNVWTAQEAIDRLKGENWKVWINPKNPEDSTLQKKFPYKQCAYMFFLWLLALYFISLGRYVK